MAAYRAAAQRDAAGMRARATAVLELSSKPAAEMRAQMLLIGMAGAAGQRDYAAMQALAAKYGEGLAQDDVYADVRRFLLAWSRQPTHHD
jgi:hypothetical protein